MKIAQIAPIAERVPPKKYGGTERVVSALTEELVKRGHEVTLFASGDSLTKAKLESVFPRGLREAHLKDIYGINHWSLLNIGLAYELQDDFDIIHDHNAPISLPAANIATTPVVITMHNAFNADNRRIFQTLRNPNIVTISQSQLYPIPNINHAGTVYNGLEMNHYPFGEESDGYLLFVGRISMEKGTHFAIEAAQQLDKRLIIAAKLEKTDQAYFREYVEPRLSDRIQWVGEVDEEERNKLMTRALAFLHPITWREPFGLTIIEANACGTPVIAFNLGAMSEIIEHGKTGFIVKNVDEMVEAVKNIGTIDRAYCRQHALSKFNAARMADDYEKIYKQVIEKARKG